MIVRLIARSRRLWKVYRFFSAPNRARLARHAPEGSGGPNDIFPDGNGWYWSRDHWKRTRR